MMNSGKLSFYLSGLHYAVRSIVSRRQIPIMGGIVINDRCNLQCRHCFVSNRNIPDLSFGEINHGLNSLYGMGMKYLYIEGGEPYLWRDGQRNLHDVISLARKIGFRYVVLYTNGTFPLEAEADTVFVSVDGVKDVHDRIRGTSYEKIISNIMNSSHSRIIINYTITKENFNVIEEFLREIRKIQNIRGTFFYLYTPYKGREGMSLEPDEKRKIIEKILYLKTRGYEIANSKPALRTVYNDSWERPNKFCYVFAENKMFACCREIGKDEICRNCGYLAFPEISQIRRLNFSAVFSAMKYY